jgi:hypothetical protein
MPKAVITFNLPEEQYAYDCANKAVDTQVALWKYSQFLRAKCKYPKNKTRAAVAEEFHTEFYECFADLLVEE